MKERTINNVNQRRLRDNLCISGKLKDAGGIALIRKEKNLARVEPCKII